MRLTGSILISVLALAVVSAANASPNLARTPMSAPPLLISGGCGPGFHRNYWGDCIPNRYGYRRHWRRHYRHYYY